MISLIEDNRSAIAEICRQYGVQRLAVFGSAVTGEFNPESSDIDLVVEFADYGPGIASRFIDFAEALEALFARPVDIVFERKLTNPYFRREVLATMEPLYDAEERSLATA